METPLQYAGTYSTGWVNLVYDQARWYDPGTGQFLSTDPDVSQTLQPFAYAGGDPENNSDPSGLAAGPMPGKCDPNWFRWSMAHHACELVRRVPNDDTSGVTLRVYWGTTETAEPACQICMDSVNIAIWTGLGWIGKSIGLVARLAAFTTEAFWAYATWSGLAALVSEYVTGDIVASHICHFLFDYHPDVTILPYWTVWPKGTAPPNDWTWGYDGG